MKKRHYKKLYKKLKDRAYIRMPLHSLSVQQRENAPRTFMAALKVYRAELNFFGQTYAKTRLLRDLFNSEGRMWRRLCLTLCGGIYAKIQRTRLSVSFSLARLN